MIYITGDCHGDWRRFQKRVFPEQKNMNRDDYMIVCGDFGIWTDDKEERWCLDELSNRSFTTLFIDGNHENFDRLYGGEFEEIDFHNGRAHKIRDNIYHLMRGFVFNIDGKEIFAFGGAASHDIDDGILDPADFDSEEALFRKCKEMDMLWKMYRVKGMSWWPEEMPSEEEMERGLENLKEHDNKVDYIISHCAPEKIVGEFGRGLYRPDALTAYFDNIAESVRFNKWFFGHYHGDHTFEDKYVMLYRNITEIT